MTTSDSAWLKGAPTEKMASMVRLASCVVLLSCASPQAEVPEILAAPAEPAPTVRASASDTTLLPLQTKTTLSHAELEAISVKQRLPDLFKRAELPPFSMQLVGLEFIGEAIAKADADMFVRFVPKKNDEPPQEISDSMHFNLFPDPVMPAGELTRYGVDTLLGFSQSDEDFFLLVSLKSQALPPELPGLIWEVTDGHVGFASLDGADLGVLAEDVVRGAGLVSAWPAVHDPVLGRHSAFQPIRSHFASKQEDDRFIACAKRAGRRATLQKADRGARARMVRTTCAKEIVAWQEAFAKAIDAEVAERAALLDKAKVRLTSLGAGH